MTLVVNGLNMIAKGYVAYGGVNWQRADVDGEDAGRSVITGEMYRDRRAIKYRTDVTCVPLTFAQLHEVLAAVSPEFFSVTYSNPYEGGDVTRTMYSNNITASFLANRPDGTSLYSVTFPLIEK